MTDTTLTTIERDELGQRTRDQIETYLDDYRHVNTVQFDGHIVKVGIGSECSFYDSDAIIGLMTRRFDLEFTGEHQGYLHFGSWQPTGGD